MSFPAGGDILPLQSEVLTAAHAGVTFMIGAVTGFLIMRLFLRYRRRMVMANASALGHCAKQRVLCVLVTAEGDVFSGGNTCANPQATCPRQNGEGYDKCISICRQTGHAEINALRQADDRARGAVAIIIGHDHACDPCSQALQKAGVADVHFIRLPVPAQNARPAQEMLA